MRKNNRVARATRTISHFCAARDNNNPRQLIKRKGDPLW